MFLGFTMETLKNEKASSQTRSMAGLLFKNTILNKTKDECLKGLWVSMTEDQKDSLKESSLSTLGSDDKNVVRSAAQAVMSLCMMELPQGRWGEVIDILCTNVSHEDHNVRFASLVTLSYIIEELRVGVVQKESTDFIITAFLDSIEKNKNSQDLTEMAISGIFHSIKFSVENFQNGHGGVIMKPVFSLTTYPDLKVRTIAMQCIVEAVRLCYHQLCSGNEFMGDITDCTSLALEKDEVEVKTQAFEVWTSIADEEINNPNKNYEIIKKVFPDCLDKMILKGIQELNIGNEEVDEEQEWGTSTAAAVCLNHVTMVIGDDVIEKVTTFVAGAINQENDWQTKYSGLVALGAILEGPTKPKLQKLLDPAVNQLLPFLEDSNPRIRYASCWLFSKLAMHHVELILNQDRFERIYLILTAGLKKQDIVSVNIASIISETAESILNVGHRVQSCILSECQEDLILKLHEYVLAEGIDPQTMMKVSQGREICI